MVQEPIDNGLPTGCRYSARSCVESINGLRDTVLPNVRGRMGQTVCLGRFVRLYRQLWGAIVPHKDGNAFSAYGTHTMIIFLNDDYQGGRLHLDTVDGVICVEPRAGGAVIFPKNVTHWTDELDGLNVKEIAILDVCVFPSVANHLP